MHPDPKNIMQQTFRHLILFSALSYGSLSLAGGPSVIAGADGNTAVSYQNPAITVHVENGDLGTLSNAAAVSLMQQAFDIWSNVDTSNISLSINQTLLDLDIDQDNAETYLPAVDQSELNEDDGINPIVFDSDGQIIDKYFGTGQSDFIIGFAQSISTTTGSFFLEGFAVISGKNSTTDDAFKLLLAHEIGHFIGLDHSQLDIDNTESLSFCDSTSLENYPLMYPVRCRNVVSLHADDRSAVSALYPTANTGDSFGTLQGIFVDDEGDAILGANIWAKNITTGEAYSIVSDYLLQGTGFYKLLLPAGSYTLHANSINTEFFDVSAVGPYASTISDISFSSPHPISEVSYQGQSEGSDEVIEITTNNTKTINFSITGETFFPSTADEDDSIADLFGGISHISILLMVILLMIRRIRS